MTTTTRSVTTSIVNEIVSRVLLFAGTDEGAVEGLLQACPQRTLAPREVLIERGSVSDHLYLLLDGQLRVHLDTPGDPLAVLEAGDCAGEIGLIDRKPASATVTADTSARVVVVNQEIFWALVDASHAMARNLLLMLTARLRSNNQMVSASLRPQREYKRTMTLDALTGLHNRLWLNATLPRQMARALMGEEALSLVMLDVDHFRRVNDIHGHLAGDTVLKEIAQTLTAHLRPTDLLARYGGEEFVAILPNTDLAAARVAAERVRIAVRDRTMVLPGGRAVAVSISLGIVQMQAGYALEDFIDAADAALGRAKDAGRDRVCD